MRRWQLLVGIMTSFTVFLLCLWIVEHQKQAQCGYERIGELEAETAALLELSGEYVTMTIPDGRIVVLIRESGESLEEFILRVDEVREGRRPVGQYCQTMHCDAPTGRYEVTLCSTTQAGLDAFIAAWCQTHTCDECP